MLQHRVNWPYVPGGRRMSAQPLPDPLNMLILTGMSTRDTCHSGKGAKSFGRTLTCP